jgi:hypothetical protein
MNRFYDAPVTAPAVIGFLLSLAGEWVAILLVGGFWLAYLARSERAEQTFVR